MKLSIINVGITIHRDGRYKQSVRDHKHWTNIKIVGWLQNKTNTNEFVQITTERRERERELGNEWAHMTEAKVYIWTWPPVQVWKKNGCTRYLLIQGWMTLRGLVEERSQTNLPFSAKDDLSMAVYQSSVEVMRMNNSWFLRSSLRFHPDSLGQLRPFLIHSTPKNRPTA